MDSSSAASSSIFGHVNSRFPAEFRLSEPLQPVEANSGKIVVTTFGSWARWSEIIAEVDVRIAAVADARKFARGLIGLAWKPRMATTAGFQTRGWLA
jgi:hypothetical protein